MMPLRTNGAPRALPLVGEGFGIDHTAGTLTAMAAWVVGGFALLFLIGSLVRGETIAAIAAIVGLVVALALRLLARAVRAETRTAQQRALELELTWADQQGVRISGYRAYLTGSRPVFDLVLPRSGYERQIMDELKQLDARILTSAEPTRVRVEIPSRQIAMQVEDTPPLDLPDLELMKRAIACARTIGIELRVEMGTHP